MLKENQHGYCPKCNMDFDDESIWETFYNQEKGKGILIKKLLDIGVPIWQARCILE